MKQIKKRLIFLTGFTIATIVVLLGLTVFMSPAKAEANGRVGGSYRYGYHDRDRGNSYRRNEVRVSIQNFRYYPSSRSVRPGTTVVWTNYDRAPHTVTSLDGQFDSGMLYQGQSYRMTVSNPGVLNYYCRLHPEMRGSIRVRDFSNTVLPNYYNYDPVYSPAVAGAVSNVPYYSDPVVAGATSSVYDSYYQNYYNQYNNNYPCNGNSVLGSVDVNDPYYYRNYNSEVGSSVYIGPNYVRIVSTR